ncbi:uncharacterized protein [Nicotiana sylvestris]|uniref:uncharacterized protein n=1 Tax=Nicotiana sylvestris TaxID=4096 RepID=UPI00388C6D8D
MDEEDVEKIAFITPWGVYYYKMVPFGLKNVGATYMRAMMTIFHDMIHKEIEIAQKLRHYFCAYTTYLIYRIDPLKYIFQKPMPTRKLSKWQILLSEFDIIYITQKVIKGQALVNHLAENPVEGEYEPLQTYFPNEEVSFVGEDIVESCDGWRMFFDRVANIKGVGTGVVLVSEIGQNYPISAKQRFPCTNNIVEYEPCIMGLNLSIDMNIQELLVIGDSDLLVHHVQGE